MIFEQKVNEIGIKSDWVDKNKFCQEIMFLVQSLIVYKVHSSAKPTGKVITHLLSLFGFCGGTKTLVLTNFVSFCCDMRLSHHSSLIMFEINNDI